MLCVLSANLMSTTRISLLIARIILRMDSACCSTREVKSSRFNLVTPSTKQRNLLPKFPFDDFDRHVVAILHRIVEQTGGDCRRVEHQLRQNSRYGQRVYEIRFT